MNYSEIKKMTKILEYEENCQFLRKEFVNHGVRFYDAQGWGYIRNRIKHYIDKY